MNTKAEMAAGIGHNGGPPLNLPLDLLVGR